MSTSKATIGRRMRLATALTTVWLIGGLSRGAQGRTNYSIAKGTIGPSLANASPGTPIELDYRSVNGSVNGVTPVYASALIVAFDLAEHPSTVKLQLSTGDIYTLPLGPDGKQGIFYWYDPAFETDYPDPHPLPQEPMPQALKMELTDGVLNAHLWAEGIPVPSGSYLFQAQLSHIVLDLRDLGSLAAHYGTTAGAFFDDGDLDADGDVDLNDLGKLASYYGGGQAQASADLQALGFDELSRAVPVPCSILIIACAGFVIRARRTRG